MSFLGVRSSCPGAVVVHDAAPELAVYITPSTIPATLGLPRVSEALWLKVCTSLPQSSSTIQQGQLELSVPSATRWEQVPLFVSLHSACSITISWGKKVQLQSGCKKHFSPDLCSSFSMAHPRWLRTPGDSSRQPERWRFLPLKGFCLRCRLLSLNSSKN